MPRQKKAPGLTFQQQIASFLVLVVTGTAVENTRKGSVRIRRALRGIGMPMDILVIPEREWAELKDEPGLIYREAEKRGGDL